MGVFFTVRGISIVAPDINYLYLVSYLAAIFYLLNVSGNTRYDASCFSENAEKNEDKSGEIFIALFCVKLIAACILLL